MLVQRYLWETKEEAKSAYNKFLKEEFEPLKKIPKNCLVNVVNDFIVYSAEQGRSKWRIQGLSYSFDAIIVPYFGATTPLTDIDHEWINKFVLKQKARGVKNSTIWHYVTDLKALFNYAIKHKPPLALVNPVSSADLRPIKNRKFIKPPLDPRDVERAAEVLSPSDRIYYDHLCFTGCRKDEGNRTEWQHLMLDDIANAFAVIPGTKTDDSLEIIPISQSHAENLLKWKEICPSERWVFPSCAPHSKNHGGKSYHRRRMFDTIRKKTAVAAYLNAHPSVTEAEAYEAAKVQKFSGGIKLVPKDLRDYFCNEVAANCNDPIVLMSLMRHKSLQTTTKYTRRILERMKSVVANFGSKKDSQQGIKSTVNSFKEVLREVREIRASVDELRENSGGGGQIRTVDSADMSRVL